MPSRVRILSDCGGAAQFFSTIEKHFNFVLDLSRGAVVPPTRVYASELFGQDNESGSLTIGSVSSSVASDAFMQFAATVSSGGRPNPVMSLDYQLTLRKAQ